MSIPEFERKRINLVNEFWFAPKEFDRINAGPDQMKRWFGFSKEFDDEISSLFKTDLDAVEEGKQTNWAEDRDGLLALVLLCDQFSRQVYRKQSKAFTFEKYVLPKIDSMTTGNNFQDLIKDYKPAELQFILLPLMHSENIEHGLKLNSYCDQQIAKVEKEENNESKLKGLINFRKFSHDHVAILEKQGRYPHRNVPLGRESTPDEIEQLKNAETFGQ